MGRMSSCVYWRPARLHLCADFWADPVHSRPGHLDALLDALGPDPRLGHRPRSVHGPAAGWPADPFPRLHDRPGVLLDPLGDSRHRRPVVRQPAARGRDRTGDPPVSGRRAPPGGRVEAGAVAPDRRPRGRAAGDVRLRRRPRAARLESGDGITPRKSGGRAGPAGVAPWIAGTRGGGRGGGLERRSLVHRDGLRGAGRVRRDAGSCRRSETLARSRALRRRDRRRRHAAPGAMGDSPPLEPRRRAGDGSGHRQPPAGAHRPGGGAPRRERPRVCRRLQLHSGLSQPDPGSRLDPAWRRDRGGDSLSPRAGARDSCCWRRKRSPSLVTRCSRAASTITTTCR